jgi:hypothetical protein
VMLNKLLALKESPALMVVRKKVRRTPIGMTMWVVLVIRKVNNVHGAQFF